MAEYVSTREEFDALPIGSVIRREKDPDFDMDMPVAAEKIGSDSWIFDRGLFPVRTIRFLADEVPYTVLYNPDWPESRELPSRDEIADVIHRHMRAVRDRVDYIVYPASEKAADAIFALLRGETRE